MKHYWVHLRRVNAHITHQNIQHEGFFRSTASNAEGSSLLDALIGVVIFALVAMSLYQAYFTLNKVVALGQVRSLAAAVLDEEIETIRIMPYSDVGVAGGLPAGVLPQTKLVKRSGKNFTVSYFIRSVDDPFDGTIGGTPNDTAPADYKLVNLTISCSNCKDFSPVASTTTVAPKSLENSSGNGAIFVRVFDAAGQPVPNANVHLQNSVVSPAISFDEITNTSGVLQLVDVPPSVNAYQVTVTKSGYSQDRTYQPGAAGNPNPSKPHLTVSANTVTQASFAIDKFSQLTIATRTSACKIVGPVPFTMTGAKLIGTSPDVIKYQSNQTTDVFGNLILPSLEWDTYNLQITSPTSYLAGSLPGTPVLLSPAAQDTLSLIMAPKTPNAILISVQDASNFLPVAGASVQITGSGYDRTLDSGQGYWQQSDWSGGAGQIDATDPTHYFSDSGSIATNNPNGELKLQQSGSIFAQTGWVISSTFDNSTSTNFYHLVTRPQNQPQQTGANPIQIQIASNQDNATWNFLGPDGTANTFYTPVDTTLNPIHNGDRYLRYKIKLQTANTNFTPNVSDIAITFTSACTPSGQVYFNDVSTGSTTITVTKPGYQTYSETFSIASGWQQKNIQLSPL